MAGRQRGRTPGSSSLHMQRQCKRRRGAAPARKAAEEKQRNAGWPPAATSAACNPATPPAVPRRHPPAPLTGVDLLLDGHEARVGKDLLQPAAVQHVGVSAEEGARAAKGGGARHGRAVVAVVPQHHNVPVVCGRGQEAAKGGEGQGVPVVSRRPAQANNSMLPTGCRGRGCGRLCVRGVGWGCGGGGQPLAQALPRKDTERKHRCKGSPPAILPGQPQAPRCAAAPNRGPRTGEGLGRQQGRQQAAARRGDGHVVLEHKGKLGARLGDVLVQLQWDGVEMGWGWGEGGVGGCGWRRLTHPRTWPNMQKAPRWRAHACAAAR